jgi:LysR family glycine cleavage system transcriptional activator
MYKLPPLAELRAFEAAARHLSFKRAAIELGVTPTAVSHHIRLLEGHCGQALFRRRPRPVSLTEAGARLFPVIRDGLQSFSATIAAIKRQRETAPLRVTTTNAFASRWLVPRLPLWRKADPAAPLDVIGTDSVLSLDAGEADVAIRYCRSAPQDGVSEELFRDTFWPVCDPQLFGSTKRLNPADLKKHTLVHCYWPPSDLEAPTWERWLAAARAKWPDLPDFKEMDHLSFHEELHAIEAVTAGQGIGIFSDVLVGRDLASGRLVKAFDLSLSGYGFYLVRRPDHPREKTISAFAECLRTVL